MDRTGILTILLLCASDSAAKTLPNIYWNSSNPIFAVDNTEHVFGAKIRDLVSIHCPKYNDTVLQSDAQYSIIYKVSKYGYDNCVLDHPVPVGQCRDPYNKNVIRIFLRKYSPVPNGLEVQPGNTYYFISTSDGSLEGINNSQGGLCRSHNVRIKIEVQDRDQRLPFPNRKIPQAREPEDFNPRFRKPTTTTKKPSTKADLDHFYSKLPNDAPDWWRPSSAPRENGDLSASAYEIHEDEENWRRDWRQNHEGNRPKQQIILFEIQEVADESQLRYRGGGARLGLVRVTVAVGLLLMLRLC